MNNEKLANLVRRLGSDSDGEVVATVYAIRRVLKADGHDLHDLAKIVQGASPPPKAQAKQSDAETPGGIIVVAKHLLETCSWLNDWEREFLVSIRDQARRRYGFKLSEKQQAILDKLLVKTAEMMRGQHG
jgi:hypothetical protein